MATIDLTKENFNDTVEKCDTIFVEFFAPWCGHCQAFTPIFKTVSDKFPETVFALVDVTIQEELAQDHDVQGVPTVIAYKKNVEVLKHAGGIPEQKLEIMVKEVESKKPD
jgi:thioredoxin-like negative regulator of GroEL